MGSSDKDKFIIQESSSKISIVKVFHGTLKSMDAKCISKHSSVQPYADNWAQPLYVCLFPSSSQKAKPTCLFLSSAEKLTAPGPESLPTKWNPIPAKVLIDPNTAMISPSDFTTIPPQASLENDLRVILQLLGCQQSKLFFSETLLKRRYN